jgi:probable F420-dependent oxidoreductase
MESASMVKAARQSLGQVGAYLPMPFTSMPPVSVQREAARRLERAGYPAAWVSEPVGGKDPLIQIALLLESTERITFGTGIANVWARAPQTAHAGAAMLAGAYPGRVVLGLGVGHPHQATAVGREFGSPLAAMRDYLDRMTAPTMTPAPEGAYPLIVAATGPKMMAMAAELADGIVSAGLPPAFTAQAREAIGPDRLLVAGLTTILDTSDPGAARRQARRAAADSLGLPYVAAAMARLGYSGRQISETSDDLVGATVAHGDPGSIAAAVRAHLDAGADHVILLSPHAADADLMTGVQRLERLAPAVLQPR